MTEIRQEGRVVGSKEMGMTACQVRMARAGQRWSVEELARRSDVSEKTIRRIESVWGYPPNTTVDTLLRLRSCFEDHGMTFMPDDGSPEGPGVRFGRYPGRVVAAKNGMKTAVPELAGLEQVSASQMVNGTPADERRMPGGKR